VKKGFSILGKQAAIISIFIHCQGKELEPKKPGDLTQQIRKTGTHHRTRCLRFFFLIKLCIKRSLYFLPVLLTERRRRRRRNGKKRASKGKKRKKTPRNISSPYHSVL
jgi:hypothetical protein